MKSLSVYLLAVLVVATTACSKSNSAPGSPASPSAPTSTAGSPPLSGGARISGTVVNGAGMSTLASPRPFFGLTNSGRVTVSVNGTSISVVSDDNGNFTLENVPPGNLTLTVTGTGFNAVVTLPPLNINDQLRITVRVNGGTATLDDDELDSADNTVEIEGLITSTTGLTSSGGTIVVGRMNTSVIVDGTTSITKGGTALKPNDLTVGMRVHVRATKTGSTMTAITVIVQNESSDGQSGSSDGKSGSSDGKSGSSDGDSGKDSGSDSKDSGSSKTTVSGTLSGVGGSCPTLTFTVGSTKVSADAKTEYSDGLSCAKMSSVGSTTKLEVTGTKQSNGSVLASEVGKD